MLLTGCNFDRLDTKQMLKNLLRLPTLSDTLLLKRHGCAFSLTIFQVANNFELYSGLIPICIIAYILSSLQN